MKTAVVQMNSGPDKKKNVERAVDLVRQAIKKGAKFILLPEVFNYRGAASPRERFSRIAESIPGDSTRPFLKLAQEHSVYILPGSVYERVPSSKKIYNTSILIDPRGRVTAKYRKIHLFSAVLGKKKIRESDSFVAGTKPVSAKVGNFTAGLSVCYDLRFPELYQGYLRKGAQLLCIPSAFTRPTGQAHFETLLRARAIENLCYVLAPNQTGHDGRKVPSFGHSMIIDPWGTVIARGSADKEEILYAEVTQSCLKDKRKILNGIAVSGK